MNSIQIFNNEKFGRVRIIMSDENKPMFLANDVARSLGYAKPANAISTHCRGVTVLVTPVQNQYGTPVMQDVRYIPESDVYRLVMRSKLPQAEQFQDWVCDEILPSIRKHGAYLTERKVEEVLTDPDTIIKIATQLKEERAARQRLAEQNELHKQQLQIAAPKVQYYNEILMSDSTYNTNQIAKELGMSAITLNRKLRERGVQYLQNGQWLLYSKYQGKGYTKTHTHPFVRSDGTTGTAMQTVWTESGRLFIHSLFKA